MSEKEKSTISLDSSLDLTEEKIEEYKKELENLQIQEEKVEENPEAIGEKEFQKEKEKRKSKEVYRHLGYHRDYLTENHRIVKTIALIVIIVIAILLIMKYMVPDDVFYESLKQSASGSAILSRLFLW